MKKLVLGISGGISFLIFLILTAVSGYLAGCQPAQNMAKRWSREGEAAQISCFFSVNAKMTEDRLVSFEHTVDGALRDVGVSTEQAGQGVRLWVDAYSADGTLTVSTDRATMKVDAVGIGGDFFLFHPLTLRYGSFFSGDDVNHDYCVIDEDAAWQLFGASDVAGMIVFIGGRPHVVTGVVRRESGRLAEAAGLDTSCIYVSLETLTKYGRSSGINSYEIVMPNPVSEFAYSFVKSGLGTDEKETEVLENTSRYSLLSRIRLVGSFGTRSMNGRAIVYPYWENIARGYEDILLAVTFFEALFLSYAVGLALVFAVLWWRHRSWTVKDFRRLIRDRAERLAEKLRARRTARRAKRQAKSSSPAAMEKGKSRWRQLKKR